MPHPTCLIHATQLSEADRIDLEDDVYFEAALIAFTDARANTIRAMAAGEYFQPDEVDTDDDTGDIRAVFRLAFDTDSDTLTVSYPPDHLVTVVR